MKTEVHWLIKIKKKTKKNAPKTLKGKNTESSHKDYGS